MSICKECGLTAEEHDDPKSFVPSPAAPVASPHFCKKHYHPDDEPQETCIACAYAAGEAAGRAAMLSKCATFLEEDIESEILIPSYARPDRIALAARMLLKLRART